MVTHTCDPSTQEAVEGGLEAQGYPQQHNKLEASLG